MWKLFKRIFMWLALKEEMEESPLGFISDKFESGEGTTDAATISNTRGDPGGKSYGVYQLSANAGTLQRYIEQSKFQAYFVGLNLAGTSFDVMWRDIADDQQKDFAQDQTDFIIKTHYIPAMMFAQTQGFDLTLRPVQEAIFSISVQHGRYITVIRQARKLKGEGEPAQQVSALYQARTKYVRGLSTLSDKLKSALVNRYVREEKDVLRLI